MDISQPAVSKAIRELEEQYETILFEKSGRGIIPTAQADILYRHTNNLRREMNDLENEIRNQNNYGNFTVGCTPDLADFLLVPAVKQMAIEYPSTEISTYIGSGYNVFNFLMAGRLDLALIQNFNVVRNLTTIALPDYQEALLVAKGHPLFNKASVTLSELAAYKLAVKCNHLEMPSGTEQTFSQKNIVPDIICRSSSVPAIVDLVLSGICASIISKPAASRYVSIYAGQLRLIEVEDLSSGKNNMLIYEKYKELNNPAKRLVELLTSACFIYTDNP